MVTKFVGIKEFRQNMAKIAKRSQAKNERLIILRKNEPIFELRPLSPKDAFETQLLADLKEAEKDVAAGRTYSLDELAKEFGL